MKIKEIRELLSSSGTFEERTKKLKEQEIHLRDELFNLQFQHKSGQLESPQRLNQVKKEIAQILTICNELKTSLANATSSEV